MGIDLIEWTYDPLQALNAHLNFAKLGVVVEEYEENIYGESSSPLHRGTPTDRFVAEWRLREPHVERRIAAQAAPLVRDARSRGAAGQSVAPGGLARRRARSISSLDARAAAGRDPVGFTEMQLRAIRRSRSSGGCDARDLPALFRPRLPRRRFLPSREQGAGHYSAGA